MADQWFRIYNTVRHDRKIRKLSDQIFRAWVMLLSLASEENGKIPQDLEDLSHELRLSVGKTEATLQTLLNVGLIEKCDENGYIPHKWHERQFKSDGSTERVKRFRQKERNVSETLPETGPESEQNRTEQNIDTGFKDFWEAYPKKTDWDSAKKVWDTLKVDPAIIISGARAYAQQQTEQDIQMQFIKKPETWLSKKGWLDHANGGLEILTPDQIAANIDKADKIFRRGKYADLPS